MDLKHQYGPDVVIGVNEAVQIFVQMWLKPWCSYKQRERGYRVVGLAEGRISIDFMPDAQFKIGEAIAAAAAEGQQLALEAAPAEAAEPEEPTPDQAIKRGTKEYLEAKVVLMRDAVDAERKRKLSPLEMDVLRASWFKPKPPKKFRKKANAVVGSINASELLEEKERLEAEATKVMREKQMAVEARVAAFELCIGGCGCNENPCLGAGLVKCVSCDQVKKSLCMKKLCKTARLEGGHLLELQATLKIPGKKAAPAIAAALSSDGEDDWESEEESPLASEYPMGSSVRVYWSMLEPAGWFPGFITDVSKSQIKVFYSAEGRYQWHNPAQWDIEKVIAIAPAAQNEASDSDDDVAMGDLIQN